MNEKTGCEIVACDLFYDGRAYCTTAVCPNCGDLGACRVIEDDDGTDLCDACFRPVTWDSAPAPPTKPPSPSTEE